MFLLPPCLDHWCGSRQQLSGCLDGDPWAHNDLTHEFEPSSGTVGMAMTAEPFSCYGLLLQASSQWKQFLLLFSNYSEFGVKHLIVGLKPQFVKGVRSQKKGSHDQVESKNEMWPGYLYVSHVMSKYHRLQRLMAPASLLLSKSQASFRLANSNLKIFWEGTSGKHKSQPTQGEITQTTIVLSSKATWVF